MSLLRLVSKIAYKRGRMKNMVIYRFAEIMKRFASNITDNRDAPLEVCAFKLYAMRRSHG